MSLTMVILMFIFGVAAMMLELFIPGGVVGALGFVATVTSIVYAFATDYTITGTVLTVSLFAFIPLFFLLWREVIGRFMAIEGSEKDFRPGTEVNETLMGKQGRTITSLHPTGVALIDGKRHHVVTRGEMVDKGATVEVIDTSGNRTVVKEVQAE
jgi:membrane-bound serine protease (ClpP class)